MAFNWHNLKYLVLETYREWSEDKASELAAAIAYYTIFSLAPLLILVVVVASQVFDGPGVEQVLEAQISG